MIDKNKILMTYYQRKEVKNNEERRTATSLSNV